MNLIHRYILRGALGTSLGAVAMFAFLLLAGRIIKDMLDMAANGHLTISVFFQLVQLMIPDLLVYALPVGLLTGILLTMGRLSAQNEVTAFRASGVGIFRLASSVVVLSILGTVASLVMNFYYGPRATAAFRQEKESIIQKDPLRFIQEKTFVKGFSGLVIYVGDKDGAELNDLWIWELDEQNRAKRFIRAESGEVRYNQGENTLILIPYRGTIEVRDPEDPENFKKIRGTLSFDTTSFVLSLDKIFGRVTFQKKLKWMTFKELQTVELDALVLMETGTPEQQEEAEIVYHKAKMAFHEKFAMGFSVLSFALIGVPLGVRVSRKETSANLFLAMGLALAYYFMMAAISWMDGLHQYRPDLLFWIPNILYQGIGCWLFYRADRGKKSKDVPAGLETARA
ncbi:MAG: YjgP/YjgQ family permease [Opitutales bacterium]|nr:YjgP/YjgQ family permease [Opitutales bacterium]MBT5816639.1 YjgP/YjgQ family permease [Opitutales bacterium]